MNAWVTRTPEELIWGYPEPLFDLAKAYLPEDSAPPMDNFGFFTKKNQTENLAQYTMYTGSGNPYNLSKISLFNGKNLWEFGPKRQRAPPATKFKVVMELLSTHIFKKMKLCGFLMTNYAAHYL
jgi:hypothetical protein